MRGDAIGREACWAGLDSMRLNPTLLMWHWRLWKKRGLVATVVTQNVDNLHEAAGHQQVIPLHGSLATVTCQNCGATFEREHIQQFLETANPRYADAAVTPDAGGEGYYAIDIDESFEGTRVRNLWWAAQTGCGVFWWQHSTRDQTSRQQGDTASSRRAGYWLVFDGVFKLSLGQTGACSQHSHRDDRVRFNACRSTC